jgi:hypothetical protein
MNPEPAGRRLAIASAGLITWLLALVALPPDLSVQARILLLAPLVIVPLLVEAVPPAARLLPADGRIALTMALPLIVGMAFPPGLVAAALSLPWLVLAGGFGIAAAWRGARQLPGILHPDRASELGTLAAFGFLAVAALFLLFDRLGFQPGGFSADIILLTAVHFHFAGFGLLFVASTLAATHPMVRGSVFGLLAGIPITAAGFVTGSTALSAAGALVTGLSGIGLALALLVDRSPLSTPRRAALRVAGLALLIGMPMGIAWSVAIALGTSFLDIDRMARTHGAVNALAVLLVALAAPRSEAR